MPTSRPYLRELLLTPVFLAMILCLSFVSALEADDGFQNVTCEGRYPGHLQGIATDNAEALYWSFTEALVKTDRNGRVIEKISVKTHHGDLCYHDGRIYVAVNFGNFNDPNGNSDNWVYVYDAKNFAYIDRHRTAEVIHGAGGIAWHDGRFFVVGGLPTGVNENYVYEYDSDFIFIAKRIILSGYTLLGIQTATFADGCFWFGCYGKKLVKTDASLKFLGKYDFDCGLGVVPIASETFLIGRGRCEKEKGCTGNVQIAVADEEQGLVIRNSDSDK